MPSTKNETLELIQREIMDVIEREKELKTLYSKNNNNNEISTNGVYRSNGSNGVERPPLTRAQSTSVLTEGEAPKGNFRRFTTNPNGKGFMQRFIKSRGKINAVTAMSTPKPTNFNNQWAVLSDLSAPKVTIEQGKRIRNGFVPIEERMRKEIQDAHQRELELRTIRRKSQPDFADILDLNLELEKPKFGTLRAAKSMAQLYDSCENLEETTSAPSSLKPARSLAELCDATEDEIQTPQNLIMQFENLISINRDTVRT